MGKSTKRLSLPVETHRSNFRLIKLPLTSTWASGDALKRSHYLNAGLLDNQHYFQIHLLYIPMTGRHPKTPNYSIFYGKITTCHFCVLNDLFCPHLHTTVYDGLFNSSSMTWPLPVLHSDTSQYGNTDKDGVKASKRDQLASTCKSHFGSPRLSGDQNLIPCPH